MSDHERPPHDAADVESVREKTDSGEKRDPSPAPSERTDGESEEKDAFEDAIDVASPVGAAHSHTSLEGTRSLTPRRSSSVKSTIPEVPTDPLPAPIVNKPSVEETETSSDDGHEEPSDHKLDDHIEHNEPSEHHEHHDHDTTQPKSPLLTSHRLSTTSLDNVNLGDDELAAAPEPPPKGIIGNLFATNTPALTSATQEETRPPLPTRNSKPSLQGLSGVLPAIPWGPPPPPPPPQASPTPPSTSTAPTTTKRSLTSPFSWLSRNTSAAPKETPTSPPLASASDDRRNTTSSIMTISSNPELMLGKLDEGHETDGSSRRPARNSLKDRFKLLRLRDEAGIATVPDDDKEVGAGVRGRSATQGLGLANTPSVAEEEESPPPPRSASVPHSPDPSVNLALSPGTASGAFAGPSAFVDPASPVDWDLWQSVVYEGPAAVVRTSADELNRAIASGIPNAIRGVVWQVLAQSKNEELESVYRDLVVRGTDKDKDRMSGSSGPPSVIQSQGSPNDEVLSSSSSIHSEHSTPATTMTNGMRSPSPPKEKDIEAMIKASAVATAEKKKKAKEDAVALNKLEKMIKRDLGARTSYSKFATSSGLQDGLFGVCKAYALFDEGVGYAQGMNFLAMPLLFNMPEEEAFCLLVRLMNQYHLRDLFIQDMPGLHKHLYQFERLLEDLEPALYCHLHRRQITPHLYATQWFLTLFAYRFPLQLVLRIYDLILSEGLEAILKFGIVLMQKNAATLLAMNDMVALTNFLRDRLFDVYIDQTPSHSSILESGFFGSSAASIDKEVYHADQMIQDACAIKLTPELMKKYNTEWEEKTRIEKEREFELESLKTANTTLTKKVRRLEERVESHDSEHAALATELVRTKVENEELNDRNESLNGQVEELRRVVATQPDEVEQRLQIEMDRLMRRNQEVHEDNTRLEDEMSSMEKTLVETKMIYAELNASHETLLRKWTDLRKALD